MTGYPDLNIPHFAEVASRLREKGHEVIDPALVCLGEGATWEDYMRVHIPRVIECEGIAMLEGWEKSRGAKLEHHIAESLKMPVFSAYAL